MSDKWTTADIPDQSGRTVVVTGANSGLGLITARELARKGANVIMACRNTAKGEEAAAAILQDAPSGKVDVQALDLADLSSVHAFAEAQDGPIDVLVNNAGVMGIPRSETKDGFEMQFGVNHLGHFALTGLLMPALQKAAEPARGHAEQHRPQVRRDELRRPPGRAALLPLVGLRPVEALEPAVRVRAAAPGRRGRAGPDERGRAPRLRRDQPPDPRARGGRSTHACRGSCSWP